MATHSPPSESHHRRIELDSPQDIAYLHKLGTQAAQQRLNTAFPPPTSSSTTATTTNNASGTEDDELRTRVHDLVSEFLVRTYTSVRNNCSANGVVLSASAQQDSADAPRRDGEEEYEPIDGKIAERIRDLERRRERALVRVAALRRDGAVKAEKVWKDKWERERLADDYDDDDDDDEIKVENEAGAAVTQDSEEKVVLVDTDALKRWNDVQTTYADGLGGLLRLKSGMAGTIGRLEEARNVGEELEEPTR